jgi:hypothetical protein
MRTHSEHPGQQDRRLLLRLHAHQRNRSRIIQHPHLHYPRQGYEASVVLLLARNALHGRHGRRHQRVRLPLPQYLDPQH